MRRYLLVVAVLVAAVWAASSCAGAEQETPAPSPRGVVAEVLTPANLQLVDGRRVHVTMMNGVIPAQSSCESDADMTLARGMLLGQPVEAYEARRTDAAGIAAPGFAQADVFTARGENYADAWTSGYLGHRGQLCPTPADPTTTPPAVEESQPGGDVYVEQGDEDSDRESRFCRGRWWC